MALSAATKYVRAAHESAVRACTRDWPCSVPLLSSHFMALAEALYSTGSVTMENRAETAIMAMPAQNRYGNVLITSIPATITHVDHVEENCMAGTRAERILSGAYPTASCTAWPHSCAATAAAATLLLP